MARPIRLVVKMNNFPKLAAEVRQKADAVCDVTANNIGREGVRLIESGPKTGRLYKRGKKVHQASAPGEAPASDIGNLAASEYAKRIRQAFWHVGFTAEYGLALEFGTPRILPRPFLRPAVEKYRAAFIAAMKQVLG